LKGLHFVPTVLFIPGARAHFTDYEGTLKDIENCGYTVRFVPIRWWTDDSQERRTGWDDWWPQVKAAYEEHDPAEVVLAGFSMGALLAFAVAAEQSPAALWLCSVSPYFSEDLPKLRPEIFVRYDQAAIAAFRRLQFAALVTAIRCPTQVFVGEHELEPAKARALATHQAVGGSRFTLVPGVGHDLANQTYRDFLVKAITASN
jgi:pimeloyl-ACP methyl ester carboxylesterase